MHQHAAHWLSQLGQWTDWASCHDRDFQVASSAESHWQNTWGFVAPLPALDSWEEGSSQTSTWELSGQKTGAQSSWISQHQPGPCIGYVAVDVIVLVPFVCVSVWLYVCCKCIECKSTIVPSPWWSSESIKSATVLSPASSSLAHSTLPGTICFRGARLCPMNCRRVSTLITYLVCIVC